MKPPSIFKLYFQRIPPAHENERSILAYIPSLISLEMNGALIRPITLQELEHVVFHMKKAKAPGPNGFPIELFQ